MRRPRTRRARAAKSLAYAVLGVAAFALAFWRMFPYAALSDRFEAELAARGVKARLGRLTLSYDDVAVGRYRLA